MLDDDEEIRAAVGQSNRKIRWILIISAGIVAVALVVIGRSDAGCSN